MLVLVCLADWRVWGFFDLLIVRFLLVHLEKPNVHVQAGIDQNYCEMRCLEHFMCNEIVASVSGET
ncbi:hypothetical protein M758_3G149100 [Ceratodon purpureus]|nr:hypothetical protein M758_3G149100 [Ceratodon purpureus]